MTALTSHVIHTSRCSRCGHIKAIDASHDVDDIAFHLRLFQQEHALCKVKPNPFEQVDDSEGGTHD